MTNTKTYEAVSKALLARKAYPLAPDENMPNREARYEQRRARVYYGKNVDLSRFVRFLPPFSSASDEARHRSTCKVSSTSLVGSSSTIGPNTFITHSVLGARVTTGSSCHISNSFIFAGAQLGDGCVVKDSVIGEGVEIAPGAVVEGGSLVGAGVVLGKGAKLEGNRVSLEQYEGDVDVRNASRESFRAHHASTTDELVAQLARIRTASSGLRRSRRSMRRTATTRTCSTRAT